MSQFYGNYGNNGNNFNNGVAFNAAAHDILGRYFSQQFSPQQAQSFVSRLPAQWPQNFQMEQTLQNAGMGPGQLRSQLVNALNQIHPQTFAPQQQNWSQPNYGGGGNYGGGNYGGNYGGGNYGGGNYGGGGYNHFGGYNTPQILAAEHWMALDSMFAMQPGFQPGFGFMGGDYFYEEAMMGGYPGMGMNMGMGMNPMQEVTEVIYDNQIANDLARGDFVDAFVDEERKDIIEGQGW